jgi:hypothetical protein
LWRRYVSLKDTPQRKRDLQGIGKSHLLKRIRIRFVEKEKEILKN